MSLQFKSSFAKVAIYRGKERFDANNPGPLTTAFFNSITRVSARSSSAQTAELTVVSEPNLYDGITILKNGGLGLGYPTASSLKQARETNRKPSEIIKAEEFKLEVIFCYPGETLSDNSTPAESYVFTGSITLPEVSISNTNITITVKASGASLSLKIITGSRIIEGNAKDSIDTLAKELGVKVDYTSKASEILKKVNIKENFQDNSFNIIRSLVKRADERLVYYDGIIEKNGDSKTIYILTLDEVLQRKPIYEFVMFRNVDTSKRIIPIYDFNYSGGSLFNYGNAFGIDYRGYNKDTKEEVTNNKIIDDRVKKSIDNDEEQSSIKINAYINNQISNENDANNMRNYEAGNVVEMNLTVPGIPDLRPQDIILVTIADEIPALSGKMMITSLEHTWDGVWLSRIECRTAMRVDAPKSPEKDKVVSASPTRQSLPI